MPSVTIKWHIKDNKACPICKELEGHEWVFVAGKDVMTDALWHPKYGIVWSLADGSNAHGGYHKVRNCRCRITHEIDMEDVLAKCVYLREIVQLYNPKG